MAQLKVTVNARGAKAGADEFRASLASMTGAAKQFESALSGMTKSAQSASRGLSSSFSVATTAANGLRSAMVALGALNLGGSIVGTIASYEQLKAVLVTTTGSVDAAGKKFKELQKFAEETPFSLAEAVQGFNHMKAVGLDPTIEKMRILGDMASIRPDRSFLDLILAISDAANGADKRIRDFGVDLKKVNGEVKVFYGGEIFATVKDNAKEIEEALLKLAQAKFGGAMERQAATLGGQWAQLKDKAANLAMEVGEGGLLSAMKDGVKEFIKLISASKETAQSFGSVLGVAVRGASTVLVTLASNMAAVKFAFIAVATYAAASAVPAILSFGAAVQFVAGQLLVATTAAGGFRVAMLAVAASNPLAWVAAGVAALVSVVAYWDEIADKVENWVPPTWTRKGIKGETGFIPKTIDWVQNLGETEEAAQAMEDFGKSVMEAKDNFDKAGIAYVESLTTAKTEIKITDEMQEAFNGLIWRAIYLVEDYRDAWKDVGVEAAKTAAITSAEFDYLLKKAKDFGQASSYLKTPKGTLFASAVADDKWMKEPKGPTATEKAAKEAQENRDSLEMLRDHLQKNIDAHYDAQREISAIKREQEENYQKYLMDKMAQPEAWDPEKEARAKRTMAFFENQAKERDKANQKTPMLQWAEDYATAEAAAQQFNDVALSGINQFSSTLATALTGGKVSWTDFYKSMQKEVLELIIKMLIATGIKAALGGATGGLSSALGATYGSFGDFMMGGLQFHSGGMVGAGGSPRAVHPSWFAAAPRYHSGTVPGLRGDEIPAILQKGEMVLSRDQVANSRSSGRTVNITNYFPDVKDGRGFGRSIGQNASRMRRQIADVEHD